MKRENVSLCSTSRSRAQVPRPHTLLLSLISPHHMAPPAPALFRVLGSIARRLGQTLDAVGAGLQGRFASPETGELGSGGEKRQTLHACVVGNELGGRRGRSGRGGAEGRTRGDGPSPVFGFVRAPPLSLPPPPHTHTHTPTVSKHRTLQPFAGSSPSLGAGAFVAPGATVVGDVTLGAGASIWYNAVVRGKLMVGVDGWAGRGGSTQAHHHTRPPPPVLPPSPPLPGDVNKIAIGPESNIQDAAVLHAARHNAAGVALPTVIGARVTVGHGATVHAATVNDGAFIGMGAVILDGAVVESGAIVAAGAVVPPGTRVPSGEVWGGAPARKLRATAPGEGDFIIASASNYASLAAAHAAENGKDADELAVDAARRQDARERSIDYDSSLGVERHAPVIPVTREITASADGPIV